MTKDVANVQKDEVSEIHSRIKIFENPFATQVNNPKSAIYCAQCLRPAAQGEKLLKCAGCNFTHYCSKDCQKLAWHVHKKECKRLQAVFPNLPLTEVLFLSKIIDRIEHIKTNGDVHNLEEERPFSSADQQKLEHFEKVFTKMANFRKDDMIPKEDFFDIFCKTTINSHSIHTNAGDEVGMSLDLGISKYNHSCRPTCSMVFDGFRVCLRPLVPGIDATDLDKAFISYIDVGRSKFARRRDLKGRWYFDCQCSRCNDPEDDILTAIKCSKAGCEAPIIVTEDEEPVSIGCAECHTVNDEERVANCQQFMKNLPVSFDPNCPSNIIQDLLEKAELILHPSNVYVARLRTALFHVTGNLTLENISSMHKQVYNNYKLCFPKADRHMGFQLLHMVKALVEKNEREQAIPYAFDAMNIFEVCFGLDHPYYLQTLALWTYLEKKTPKSVEELVALTNFTDNRPVDIVTLLKRANMLPPPPETNQLPIKA